MKTLVIGKINGPLAGAARIVRERGAQLLECSKIEEALEALRKGLGVDLVLVEINFDVAKLVASLKQERIVVPVVCCGPPGATKEAVAAIRAGAKEYLPLPPDEEMISAVLEAAANISHRLLWFDEKMGAVVRMAERIAKSTASVMITGESGTGKEMIAHHIHQNSNRKNERFIAINCAAIPETLLESELFGHERGAFTGAVARRLGKFEEANGGTLLLDEISEMSPLLQAKLLRVLQEKEIDRLGSSHTIKVDVRVLATSNRDLQAEVKAGNFREDLFFRLNVVAIEAPALKDRPKDITGLSQHFVERLSAMEMCKKTISTEALRKLSAQSWPGNVRELENVIHRAVLMSASDKIEAEDIFINNETPHLETEEDKPSVEATIASGALVGRSVADVERELIISTLDNCIGNRTHAANILGISIRTLRNKLKQYSDEGHEVAQASVQRSQ